MEAYSPDDNRFDLRPFLYNLDFKHQFDRIDRLCEHVMTKRDRNAIKADPSLADVDKSTMGN